MSKEMRGRAKFWRWELRDGELLWEPAREIEDIRQRYLNDWVEKLAGWCEGAVSNA